MKVTDLINVLVGQEKPSAQILEQRLVDLGIMNRKYRLDVLPFPCSGGDACTTKFLGPIDDMVN